MKVGLELKRDRSNNVAVLAIDLITGFSFKDGTAIRRAAMQCESAILRLLTRARHAGAPVIYVNDNYGLWRSDASQLVKVFSAKPRSGMFVTSLAPGPQDLIVLKPRHSAFFGTPLGPLLESLEIGKLVLAGISAESCVWMTACDAHTRDYELIVPMDTMASASAKGLNATLTGLRTTLGARTPRGQASVRFKQRSPSRRRQMPC
jgi:nicotinamidase-related amidase